MMRITTGCYLHLGRKRHFCKPVSLICSGQYILELVVFVTQTLVPSVMSEQTISSCHLVLHFRVAILFQEASWREQLCRLVWTCRVSALVAAFDMRLVFELSNYSRCSRRTTFFCARYALWARINVRRDCFTEN